MPGVYISYPFCAQKCTYCNFASGVFPRSLEAKYMAAVRAEIARHRWEWEPETLYLGGGTPSAMDPCELEGLLALVPGREWIEATIEAAPGNITGEKARAWFRSGITRASLGVQSFVQREISRTGRKHTAEVVAQDIQTLRESGIRNINVDLIAGLAGQTESSWSDSLDWIERLAPEHVSVYMLEVDEDSRLGREILSGGMRYGASDTPSEELVVDLYVTAAERLPYIGFEHYEISNFARRGFESRHNLKYWKLEPYVGFGADAHSFDGVRRWQNPDSVAEYIHSPKREYTEADAAEEKFFVGLRLSEGVRPNADEWNRYREPIHRFIDAGLLETDGNILRLTSRGVLLSNEVFQEFVTK